MRFTLLFRLLLWIYYSSRITATKHRHQHAQVGRNTSREAYDMGDVTNQRGSRTKWTEKMCVDLQTCKIKAVELNNSPDCPLKPSGRKEGVMNLTLRFWNEMGYEYLGKFAQNLRDKIAHIDKSTKTTSLRIANEINNQIEQREEQSNSTRQRNCEQRNCEQRNPSPKIDLDEQHKDIKQMALATYNKIKQDKGNWETRDLNTFSKKKPNNHQLLQLNQIASEITTQDPSQDPGECLWELNCLLYSLARAWKVTMEKNIKMKDRQQRERKPRWLKLLDKRMNRTRKEISQVTAEIDRTRCNGKLTKTLWKNRNWMKKELRTNKLGLAELTSLKEKKLNIIRMQKQDKKNKIKTFERRKINNWFDQNERSFYKHLRSLTANETDPDNLEYKNKTENQGIDNPNITREEYENFWCPIWQDPAEENLDVEWIHEVREALDQSIPDNENLAISITGRKVHQCLKSKRNWAAPGKDKITNFWLKKITSIHDKLAKATSRFVNDGIQIPRWLVEGKTVLIPKTENPGAADHRPITCLNTMYKLITSIVNWELQLHELDHKYMQIDQRGGMPGSMGCIDNLLIDKAILEDATKNTKNLSCTWIDVKKAFDNVSHAWLIEVLRMHKINEKLVTFVQNVMRSWKITLRARTNEGIQEIGPITIKRGILQGDAFCVKLFTLCLNPIAWYIRGTEGYNLSHAKNVKITHCLYVDDLKTYHKNSRKATTLTNRLEGMFNNIGLEWGIHKCAAIHITKGKLQESQSLPLTSGSEIPVLGEEDHYKFLGKLQNVNQLDKQVFKQASLEYLRRLAVIWTSPLSIPRKVKATNTFAYPVLQYYMWSCEWAIEDLQELDRKTRAVIAQNKGKHNSESNPMLYLSSDLGGRGLKEIEIQYKVTKIKTAHYITTSKDPHIEIVRTFQDTKEEKKSRSVIKDAKYYAQQLNLDITFDEQLKCTTVKMGEKEIVLKISSPKYIQQQLKEATDKRYQQKVSEQLWLGNYVSQRWKDNDISNNNFNPTMKWKNIPDVVLSVHTSILQQLVPTKVYRVKKQQDRVSDLMCTLCHNAEETIPHLLCGCSAIAQTIYKARHDRMLRPIYHLLLSLYNMENDESKAWYKQAIPKTSTENDQAKILWDTPIYIDKAPENGANKPDMTVYVKKSKEIILVEGTVCNIGQINDRNEYKKRKYLDLRLGLRKLYPGYEIKQINIVFNFLGDFNSTLVKELSDLANKKEVNKVLNNCQKWIISQNCEVIKKFYSLRQ